MCLKLRRWPPTPTTRIAGDVVASTSIDRDRKASEVRRLAAAGLSQRQIASRLGVTRPMVQRILASSDPVRTSADPDVDEFRREVTEVATEAFQDRNLDALKILEGYESQFNDEYCLAGNRAVKIAKLRRMMLEGILANG